MSSKIKFVAFEAIKAVRNVRVESLLDIPSLMESIKDIGLETRLVVHELPDGINEVLRGHRRLRAIGMLKDTYPERFNELFAKGVECEVYKGLTLEEVAMMKIDHGNIKQLRNRMEVYNCIEMLFDAGLKERAVVVKVQPLLDSVFPVPAARLREIEALPEDSRAQELVKLRHGVMQGLGNIYKAPYIVKAAYALQETGEKPEGFEGDFLPKLTTGNITKLKQASDKDFEHRDKAGHKVYDQKNTGPEFKAAWKAICDKQQEAAAEPTAPRPKAMSAKGMLEEEKNWLSFGFVALTKHHGGDADITGTVLGICDEMLFLAELVAEGDKALWDKVISKAAEIKKAAVAS